MKFMKLGSKPDSFQTDGNNMRYVATELATDIVVHVGDVKFYLHKFPLLSKSARLQKLVLSANGGNGNSDEVHIHDIPGSYSAFEICAKFCYGMTVTLNAYNVVAVRCAAEYLEMHEIMDKGNLIFKVDVFMNSSIFRSWKDSIIVLQTTKSLLPFSEELKLTGHCIDAVASKASVNVSKVDWSYTYNRKKLPDENGIDPSYNGVRSRMVPNDWWVEDLCELEIDIYKRVIITLKNKGVIPNEVIGDALKAYAYRKLPSSSGKGVSHNDISKYRTILNTIVSLLPTQKNIVSCSFLLKLLKAAISVDSGEAFKDELVKRIGQQLEEASVIDLLFRAQDGETTMYDVHLVHKILKEFRTHDQNANVGMENGSEIDEDRKPGNGILSEASKLMVAKLVDNYLAEIAKDPNLPLSMFISIAEMVSSFSRPSHDVLYRAIDAYLKEHPGISKSERKQICRLMDCKKLSAEMCMHAVQNERLPLRVVVQVLFFEQVRAAASSGSSTPDLPKAIKDLNCGSYGSSRSITTNNDEDWDAVASAAELRALRGELAAFRLGNGAVQDRNVGDSKMSKTDKAVMSKMKGLIMSKKILSKILSSKGGQAENSGSDSSESRGSTNHDETKAMATGKGRHSVS